jgi:GNAT superfamily N-acetyltransferase
MRDLAGYEKSLDEVTATEEDLHRLLFCEHPAVFAHVATSRDVAVGFALWFLNYSTWAGRHGIYLEDLYVMPEERGRGYGRALLAELAGICAERGYGRLEWSVLNWNAPSIAFYESLGAEAMREWTTYRLSGAALHVLGAGRVPAPGRGHPGDEDMTATRARR